MKSKWWIKERHNPQLGVYYVACGQLSQRATREKERGSLYGSNVMHGFDTQAEYETRLAELKEKGELVQ